MSTFAERTSTSPAVVVQFLEYRRRQIEPGTLSARRPKITAKTLTDWGPSWGMMTPIGHARYVSASFQHERELGQVEHL